VKSADSPFCFSTNTYITMTPSAYTHAYSSVKALVKESERKNTLSERKRISNRVCVVGERSRKKFLFFYPKMTKKAQNTFVW